MILHLYDLALKTADLLRHVRPEAEYFQVSSYCLLVLQNIIMVYGKGMLLAFLIVGLLFGCVTCGDAMDRVSEAQLQVCRLNNCKCNDLNMLKVHLFGIQPII